MRRPLSAKREFHPSNPDLEKQIHDMVNTPIKLSRQPPPPSPPRYVIHETRKSLPSKKVTINEYDVERDTTRKGGARRAFDQKHKIYSAIVLKQGERQWKDDEKFWRWKTAKEHQKYQPVVRERDYHTIEGIVQERNDHYMLGFRGYRKHIQGKHATSREAPSEIRSKSVQGQRNILFW